MFHRRFVSKALSAAIGVAVGLTTPSLLDAQTLTSSARISGAILDPSGQAAPDVAVSISGVISQSTTTDATGVFSFTGLPPGLYRLNATKASFRPLESDVTVAQGEETKVSLRLTPTSFSTITEIGRTSTSSSGAVINTSTAATATLSGNDFIDQGQLNVVRMLDQVPGFVMGGLPSSVTGGSLTNAASPLFGGVPQIRGSLPYETESLIDGHPISLGVDGAFNPVFINPYLLQNVEIVKGPGAVATNINNAIGGTVNFRTLEPTSTPHQSGDVGIDQFGGQFANLRATGSAGRFGYALDYATQGTQGFQRGWDVLNPNSTMAAGSTVNGIPVCQNPAANPYYCGLGILPGPAFAQGSFDATTPLVTCCPQVPQESNSRNELAKLRYNFTPSTSLTVSYLGAQVRGNPSWASEYGFFNTGAPYEDTYTFQPPPGYGGAIPGGIETPIDYQGNGTYSINADMYAAEFRTALGPVTVNARYYSADINSAVITNPDNTISETGLLYGGVILGNATTPTIFNGTPGTVTNFGVESGNFEKDKLGGFTVQLSAPIGKNYLSWSYDSVSTTSAQSQQGGLATTQLVYPGSGQKFQTIATTGQLELFPGFQATLSNYATLYTDHYTQDFGATFIDSSHAYDAPRLGLRWRPTSDWAVRAAAGYSIAPPYLSLLTNSAPVPGNQYPTTFYKATANAGSLAPETAFGWDLGADRRIGRNLTVSGDVYQTLLRNQFLTTVVLSPTLFTSPGSVAYGVAPGSYPIYYTTPGNLGHSQYRGVELAINEAPPVGFGFKLQGALIRAFAYDLPPGFYNSAAGPNTANQGILPNINFQGGGLFVGGLSPTPVPYSQGYAEVNWRSKRGARALLGATYYGNNNTYYQPAFAVVNASYDQPLTKDMAVRLSVTNLTNAYNLQATELSAGIPSPLISGLINQNSARFVGPSTASLTLHVAF